MTVGFSNNLAVVCQSLLPRKGEAGGPDASDIKYRAICVKARECVAHVHEI